MRHEAIKSGKKKLQQSYSYNLDFEIDNPLNNAFYARFLRKPENLTLKQKIENEPIGIVSAKAVATIISKLQPRDYYAYDVLQGGALNNKITNPNNQKAQNDLDEAINQMIENNETEYWKRWDEYDSL